jgi:hypothetical protein
MIRMLAASQTHREGRRVSPCRLARGIARLSLQLGAVPLYSPVSVSYETLRFVLPVGMSELAGGESFSEGNRV